jgi:hypothetical protein
MTPTRTSPPSTTANNQDVFIWALFVLGGSDREIDVEDIYLKAFDMAPARLGWRTKPELPDYKKTSKALQSVEAKTHVGLVHKTHANARKLTASGVAWVEMYRDVFEQVYSRGPVAAANTNAHEKRRKSIQESKAWKLWSKDGSLDLFKLSEALTCSPGSPVAIWKSRVEEVSRAGNVLQDKELIRFADAISMFVKTEVDK